MDIISTDEFNAICNDANTKTIKFGKIDQPKVFEINDNIIIKLFYPKKSWLSSDRIWPRAMRFYNNVKALNARGYEAPRVDKVQFCRELKIYLLYYPKIQGKDVRSLASHGEIGVIRHVAHLIAGLHINGIFFRSIHLENLLYQSQGKMAFTGCDGCPFKSGALRLYSRYRNLKHLFHLNPMIGMYGKLLG